MFQKIREETEQLTIKIFVNFIYQVNQMNNVLNIAPDKKLNCLNLKSPMSGRLFLFSTIFSQGIS